MTAIFKREIRAYFTTSLGYVFLGMFMLVSGLLFAICNIMSASASLDLFFFLLTLFLTFLLPILTMRLMGEDEKLKTDRLLMTSPVKATDIAIGKFLAAVSVYSVALILTFLYLIVLANNTTPEYSKIFCQYIGIFLLGISFISIGLFISSLTESQMVACIITFVVLMTVCFLEIIQNAVISPAISGVIGWIAVRARFEEFNLGVLNVVPVVYYLSVTAFFVFLTGLSLESKRFK